MGTQRQRLINFLARHPKCCYCGGTADATTQDHFPPRALFIQRQWPEGYVYPACESCNNQTSQDETLVTLVSRMYPHAESDVGQQEFERLLLAVRERFPDVFRSLNASSNDVRRWLKTRGFTLPAGMTTADIPLASLKHPRIAEAVERFATKLFCSLYYRHANAILGPEGGIVFKWVSNAQDMDKMLPKDVLSPLLSNFPALTRQNTSLHEQFFYRFAVAEEPVRAGAFLAFFNKSLAMLGFVFSNLDGLRLPEHATVLQPFSSRKEGMT